MWRHPLVFLAPGVSESNGDFLYYGIKVNQVLMVARSGARALISTSGVFSTFEQKKIVALVKRSRLPAIFTNRDRVVAGGLMSYNRQTANLYLRAATYVDKILKGARPADLPIAQPTKFDLVINLKTVKALGVTIPPSILLRADEVIE